MNATWHGQQALQALVQELQQAPSPAAMQLRLQPVDRRTFLRMTGVAGGGLMLAFAFGCAPADETATGTAEIPPGQTFAPNGYLQISHTGILIYAINPEVGQGVKTALPMIIAEELDAAWDDVQVLQADIDPVRYGMQFAGGSRSVPQHWLALRRAGAVARKLLVAAAAIHWQLDASSLQTRDSHVIDPASGRRRSYLALADLAAELPVPDPATVSLKPVNEFRLLGQFVSGVDNPALVRGAPLFASDLQLPGMKIATYVKGPATGARVAEANLDAIRALPGIQAAFVLAGNGNVTELMPGVAIIGDDTWAVLRARQQLQVQWDETDAAKDSWSAGQAQARRLRVDQGELVAEKGELATAMASADKRVEAYYEYHFVAHAQLEPQTTLAWVHDGQVELWAPSQTPGRAIQNVANVLNVPVSQIKLHQQRGGGGFGRRLVNDFVCEAAAIAQQVDYPIKLQWTREDDMSHDFFRAGGFHFLRAALDTDGAISAWQQHEVAFSADGSNPVTGAGLNANVDPAPFLANYRLTRTLLPWATPCGAWRAPGSNVFAFVLQGFLHELSSAAGRDHLEFLLALLGEPRLLQPDNPFSLHTGRAADVLRLAAEKAGWGQALPPGRGMGIAFYFSHAGHFAEVVDLSVTADKRLQIHKITVAGDVGPIVNLSGARAQVEGSVLDALSTLMNLAITHEQGRVQETNFHAYPLLRIGQAPPVEMHFVASDYPPTGLGEPAVPPLAPALANAIFAATGERVRSMPLSKLGYRL